MCVRAIFVECSGEWTFTKGGGGSETGGGGG